MGNRDVLIEVKNLKKYFKLGRKSIIKAVDDVSFDIYRGETLGFVGESGCGKTTCGKTLVGLLPVTGGQVIHNGRDISGLSSKERKSITKEAQIIFQDPYASLNPRMTVGDIIGEGIDIHGIFRNRKREERIYELLDLVGLNREHISRFPHEFSGGQRQRIGIARALAVEPEFIVCDEPISALDVSIQAQIVNLLIELQRKQNLSYFFISHDLSMVKHISDRIGVMYLGKIVELTTSEKLYENPLHPYTNVLLSAIPIADPRIEREKERKTSDGEISSSGQIIAGCKFEPRCDYAMEMCRNEEPPLIEVSKDHFVACHKVK